MRREEAQVRGTGGRARVGLFVVVFVGGGFGLALGWVFWDALDACDAIGFSVLLMLLKFDFIFDFCILFLSLIVFFILILIFILY